MNTTEKLSRDSFEFFARLCRTNTGSSMLDSGKIYGYQYERPLTKHEDPPVKIGRGSGWINVDKIGPDQLERFKDTVKNIGYGNNVRDAIFVGYNDEVKPGDAIEAEVFISLPHFLESILETNDKVDQLQRIFQRYCAKNDFDTMYLGYVEYFCEWLASKGIDIEFERGYNTYNSDNDFDQDMWFAIVKIDGEEFVAVSPHCGCDARGGYPMPQFYAFQNYSFDYWWTWQVDFYCPELDAQFESMYDFDRGGYRDQYETRSIIGEDGGIVFQCRKKGDEQWEEAYHGDPTQH